MRNKNRFGHHQPQQQANAVQENDNIDDEEYEEDVRDASTVDHEEAEEDPYVVLQKQYDALKREKAELDQHLVTESQTKHQLRQTVDKYAANEKIGHKAIAEHALMAARAEAENAERAYAEALANSDPSAAAKAQRLIARTEAQILRIEEGLDYIENSPAPVVQTEPSFEEKLAATNLTPRTKDYVRQHPEIVGAKQNAAVAAHILATESHGLKPDTDEYFDFIDQQLGYTTMQKTEQYTQDNPRPKARINHAAPANSSGGDRRVNAGQERLTPEEKDTARALGMSLAKYAENKAKIRNGQAGKLEFRS
jgi:hypothetical protein